MTLSKLSHVRTSIYMNCVVMGVISRGRAVMIAAGIFLIQQMTDVKTQMTDIKTEITGVKNLSGHGVEGLKK